MSCAHLWALLPKASATCDFNWSYMELHYQSLTNLLQIPKEVRVPKCHIDLNGKDENTGRVCARCPHRHSVHNTHMHTPGSIW